MTAPLRRPERLARVESKYGVTFQWERLPKISRELLPLLLRHYEETKYLHDVELDLDWDLFYEYDTRGILHICTARQDGNLVGYIFNLVGPHLHHLSIRWAASDMYWLEPSVRLGWLPVKFFLENLRGLKERECQYHAINTILNYKQGRVGKLFQRLGYIPREISFVRAL